MLNWLGAAMILTAGTAYGFLRASRYAKRPQELRQMAAALGALETEMVYGLSPLPQAMERVAAASAPPVSLLFSFAAERMKKRRAERTAGECWEEAVREVWPKTAMKEAEMAALLTLSATLGATDRDDQVKHLRFAAAKLAVEEEAAREEAARYGKMWRSLGLLAAALIVILMY